MVTKRKIVIERLRKEIEEARIKNRLGVFWVGEILTKSEVKAIKKFGEESNFRCFELKKLSCCESKYDLIIVL